MKYLMLLILSFVSGFAYSYDLKLDGKLSEVDEMYIEYRHAEHLRDPYYPENKDDDWRDLAEFRWKWNSYKILFWENNLHLRTDASQVRHVGWEYTIGLNFTKYLSVVKYHHSQHCTECEIETRKFPVEDSYGIRFYLVPGRDRDTKRR